MFRQTPVWCTCHTEESKTRRWGVEIKCQLDATDELLLQILLLAQHVSGTIMPIVRSSRVLYKWLLPVVFGAWFSSCRYGVELRVVCPVCGLQLQPANQTHNPQLHTIPTTWKPNTTGSNQLYNTLELLMMGIMVPETCWACNKIYNKKHLLHLVGILFPHGTDMLFWNVNQSRA
jgi:hypothetical protein